MVASVAIGMAVWSGHRVQYNAAEICRGVVHGVLVGDVLLSSLFMFDCLLISGVRAKYWSVGTRY